MALYEIKKNASGVPTGEYEAQSGAALWADLPVGTIVPYGSTSTPSGWLGCEGQAVSRTTFAELFAVIGTTFGAGDESTTFNVPDMREAVPKGTGLSGKSSNHYDSDGVALGEFIDDRVQSHIHSTSKKVAAVDTNGNAKTTTDGTGAWFTPETLATSNNSGRNGATTEVKSVGCYYMIKARQIALPADLQAQVADAFDSLIGPGDNPPFVQDTTILDYIKGLDSDVSFVTFAVAQSSPNVTDKPANKGFYYFGHKVGTSWQIIAMSTDKRRCYMTNFAISASEISWMELMTRDSFKWSKLGSYSLAKTEYQDINVASYSEFLVQLGDKNASQPYGGMTYIDTITGDHSNVSFIPVYNDNGYQGSAYIFQNSGTLRIKNASRDATLLFYVYVR